MSPDNQEHRRHWLLRTAGVWRRIVQVTVLAVLLTVFISHALVRNAAASRITGDYRQFPPGAPIVVLGTSRYTRSGAVNAFFEHRMDAAEQLFITGAFPVIIVSGGRTEPGYDEPEMMYRDLLERGISSEYIIRDGAGFRTLDSVIRMKGVFQQQSFVVVSQPFHLERALFIADAYGLDAWGYPAADASGMLNLHVRMREFAARVQAIIDVYIMRTAPRALMIPVPIEFPRHSP